MNAGINRRNALRVVGSGGVALLCGTTLLGSAYRRGARQEKDVGPIEDLMREHGILSRILLLYEESARQLTSSDGTMSMDAIRGCAEIIQQFIGQYHEKLEEDHVFPRLEKAGKLRDLVQVLREQHDAGRRVNDTVVRLAADSTVKSSSQREQVVTAMQQFIRMYRPHKAREDTVLFPAFHDLLSDRDFDSIGAEFENKERQLFGERGFESIVDKVTTIEKSLGVYALSQFTPKT